MDYEAVQKFHIERCLPHFTFHIMAENLVKIVIRNLSGNISSEGITIALQELDSDLISVTLMNVRRLAQEGGVTYTHS
jgi:hypothetical protein